MIKQNHQFSLDVSRSPVNVMASAQATALVLVRRFAVVTLVVPVRLLLLALGLEPTFDLAVLGLGGLPGRGGQSAEGGCE